MEKKAWLLFVVWSLWVFPSWSHALASEINLGPWQIRHPHPSDYIRGLAHDGQKFVLVDGYGHIFTSVSGRNWTLQNTPGPHPLRSVAFGGTNFVAIGLDGVILRSPDGTNWVSAVSPTTNELTRIIYTGQGFVAVGLAGTIVSSISGTEFVVEEPPVSKDLLNVGSGPGTILAVGERTVLVSTNTGEWKQALVTTTNYFADVTYFKGVYHNGYYATSDPMIWTNRAPAVGVGFSNVVLAVTATTNAIARLAGGRRFQWSSDGINWSTSSGRAPFPDTLTTISNRFQMLGDSELLFADQFHQFTQMAVKLLVDTSVANYFTKIGADTNGFAVKDSPGGRFFASKDGQLWRLVSAVPGEPLPNVDDLRIGELPWARSPYQGSVEISDDGEIWTSISSPAQVQVAAALGNTIVAAGTSNLWATTDRATWTKIKTKQGPLIAVADDFGSHLEPDRWILSFSRGDGMIVATTSWGELLFSQDGFEWQTVQTVFPRIDDAALTPEKVVVVAWKAIAEARFDGGVDPVIETKLRLASDQLELEGPLRHHAIESTTNFTAWKIFGAASTNTNWQIDPTTAPTEFFRTVRPD